VRPVHVGCAALNQTPLDWSGNVRRIEQAIGEARQRGVRILCLPELSISGYGCEDAFLSRHVAETSLELLSELIPHSEGMVVAFSIPFFHRRALYNTACLAVDGKAAGLVGKQNLAGDGVHYEPRWFKPWRRGEAVDVDAGPLGTLPLGDLIFDCDGIRVGFEICEDAWVADRTGRHLAGDVDLLLNPSASHFAFGKQTVRRRQATEGSRAFGVAYIFANLLGNEAGRAIYDGGLLIASEGRRIAEADRFSYAEVVVEDAVIDIDANRMDIAERSHHERGEGARMVAADLSIPAANPESLASPLPAIGDDDRHWEFESAIALGLFDYLRKSRSQGYVVSLSGGADSTAVSLLAAASITKALEELGANEMASRLHYLSDPPQSSSPEAWVSRLLTCVYQATRNSSRATADAARVVADALGAEFHSFAIDEAVDFYLQLGQQAAGRSLTWDKDDLALQNIQARSRGPSVWLLANIKSALLLATSNRSEAAVGYATMDGDTCGGLSPIAGIDKDFLLGWLRAKQAQLPALEAVNRLQPTAELRPPGSGQTDESDLMPYSLLEQIEDAAIRDRLNPLEAFRSLRSKVDVDDAELAESLVRFYRLWARNQWKRERYAPSFHVDDKNLDPKTWCRFPILSGGFERELEELIRYLAGESKSEN